MTDARLKGEWLTAAAHDGLSDAAYRVFHNALMHSNEQGTDGAITARELRFLYPGQIAPEVLTEIATAGFWETTEVGYQLIGWSTTLGQSTAADVDAIRAANRDRKRAQRARERGASASDGVTPTDDAGAPIQALSSEKSHRESRRLSRRDVTQGVGQDRPPEGAYLSSQKKRASASARGRSGPTLEDIRRECAAGRHRLVGDGSCMHCEYRSEREAS